MVMAANSHLRNFTINFSLDSGERYQIEGEVEVLEATKPHAFSNFVAISITLVAFLITPNKRSYLISG